MGRAALLCSAYVYLLLRTGNAVGISAVAAVGANTALQSLALGNLSRRRNHQRDVDNAVDLCGASADTEHCCAIKKRGFEIINEFLFIIFYYMSFISHYVPHFSFQKKREL